MREADFQRDLVKKIEKMFPECIVTKMEPYIQGIPDLLILCHDKWAMLECKKSEKDRYDNPRPNQEYYVDLLNEMSFAAFIYPENEEETLREMEQALLG